MTNTVLTTKNQTQIKLKKVEEKDAPRVYNQNCILSSFLYALSIIPRSLHRAVKHSAPATRTSPPALPCFPPPPAFSPACPAYRNSSAQHSLSGSDTKSCRQQTPLRILRQKAGKTASETGFPVQTHRPITAALRGETGETSRTLNALISHGAQP